MRRDVSAEEIEGKWMPKRLMDQLAWLAEIGFSYVDVSWKQYNFAVYGGRTH